MNSGLSPSSARRARPARGFTLLEMMVVVAILGIIAAVAAPGMHSFLLGQQVKGLAFDMTNDLLLARSEALKRNLSVSVARSGDSWNTGWTTVASGTSELISKRNASASSITVSGAPASITFDYNGRVSSPTSEVRVSISSGGASRCVELSLSGRASSTVGACS